MEANITELLEKFQDTQQDWGRDNLVRFCYKAGYDKRESEFVYNPDYLDFQKGVKTGKELGIRKVVEWVEKQAYKQFTTDKDLHLNCKDYQELKEWGIE